MKAAARIAIKTDPARKTKDDIASERETSFREGERARRAAEHRKTARLRALRLTREASVREAPTPADKKEA